MVKILLLNNGQRIDLNDRASVAAALRAYAGPGIFGDLDDVKIICLAAACLLDTSFTSSFEAKNET